MFTAGQPQGATPIAPGAALYIFNRKDFKVTTASVAGVSQPHISKAAQANPALGMQGFVVDVTLTMGNDTTSVEYPVNSPGANYPDKGWFISPDRQAVTREVEAAANTSRQFLAQRAFHEMVVEKAPALILQLNPERQVEAQQAEQIARLEERIAAMSGKFDQVVGLLSAAVQAKNTKQKEEK